MNWLDIFLGIVLLIGIVRGFLNGFVYEIANLGAFFLGLYCGFELAEMISPKVSELLGAGPSTVRYVSLFLVFVAIWIGMILLSKLFEGLITVTMMGLFNKIAGALFGLLKFTVIASVLIYFFHKADTKYRWIAPDTKAESKLYYPMLKTAPFILPVLKNLEEEVDEQFPSKVNQ
jgi:membrane protein required for colicin V production